MAVRMDETTKTLRKELAGLVKEGTIGSFTRSKAGQYYVTHPGEDKLLLLGGPMQVASFLLGVRMGWNAMARREGHKL